MCGGHAAGGGPAHRGQMVFVLTICYQARG